MTTSDIYMRLEQLAFLPRVNSHTNMTLKVRLQKASRTMTHHYEAEKEAARVMYKRLVI